MLIQNQGAMLKSGRLATPYKGIIDCTKRTYASEGLPACLSGSFYLLGTELDIYKLPPVWRGNTANIIRYFPTQALNLFV